MTKDDFMAALGGPAAPVGPSGATAQTLADALEICLRDLTSPGIRVYPAALNHERFWAKATDAVNN